MMKKKLIIGITFSLFALSSVFAGHKGPNYGGLPSGIIRDSASSTCDVARGGTMTVEWTDRFNKKHKVQIKQGEQVTIAFPVPHGGNWIWFENGGKEEQRTGFNPSVTWIQATFSYQSGNFFRDPSIRIDSTGYRTEPVDRGLWGQVQDRVKEASELAAIGAKTAKDVISIGTAAGLLK